jgi:hypothetical protein
MDHHTVAAVSITGTCLDVLGSLYLAYDLLGGQHGPLRLLTRAVTYSIVFGIGYGGLGLGLVFGVASGITTGVTLSIEFNRAARGARSLLVALGSTVFRDPRIGLRSRTLQDCGLSIRNRLCPSHHDRSNSRLLSRYAPGDGLCSGSPSTADPSSVLGNGGPHGRLHGQRPCLQYVHSSLGKPLVICNSRRVRDRQYVRSRAGVGGPPT